MRLVLAGLALFGCVAIAFAEDFNEERMGIHLGTILAAEQPCGFSYDQSAIKKYIAENVPASSISFPATLMRWTEAQKSDVSDLVGAEKSAYCAATEHTAKSFGFIQ